MKMVSPSLNADNLLKRAQQLGMSVKGEMFCSHEWAHLARSVGLKASTVPIDDVQKLFQTRNGIAAIPYDVDESGIAYEKGEKAHWSIVWKFWKIADEPIVLMAHSSCKYPLVEKWKELVASNKQMIKATLRVDSEHIHRIETKCLAGSAVWIDL
jgi:hypothetical protein